MGHSPARSRRVYFSFPYVTDPDRHPAYNAWHQLDHRPENLALPGVVHGDRWVRSPRCVETSTAVAEVGKLPAEAVAFGQAHYAAMYWFADPVTESVEEWLALGQTTLEQGRRPDLQWTERRVTGFFRPVAGQVGEGVRISPGAVPFAPHRGVVLEVLHAAEPGGVSAERGFDRLHRHHLSAVRAVPGVVGTWVFASRDVTLRPGAGEPAVREQSPGAWTVLVHWVDTDPVEAVGRFPEAFDVPGVRTVLRTPLETVEAGAWDWFAQR